MTENRFPLRSCKMAMNWINHLKLRVGLDGCSCIHLDSNFEDSFLLLSIHGISFFGDWWSFRFSDSLGSVPVTKLRTCSLFETTLVHFTLFDLNISSSGSFLNIFKIIMFYLLKRIEHAIFSLTSKYKPDSKSIRSMAKWNEHNRKVLS